MTLHEAAPESPLLAEQRIHQQKISISEFNEKQKSVLHELESTEDTWLINIHGSARSGKTFLS
jgi:predicted ribonuclease YlaK